MNERERIIKMMTATPDELARIDAILRGADKAVHEEDCRLVTFTEAAKIMNVSRPTVYRLAKCGYLEVVPLRGVNRIRRRSIVDYVNGKGGAE